jgi:pSer/pThr/pTyr-binding forkhead associated (FHA) protein
MIPGPVLESATGPEESSSQTMPRLDFYADYELFVKVRLEVSEVTIGRSEKCTVQLPDDLVSRVHAVIRPRDDGYELEDRSLNGTLVNKDVVRGTIALRPGDRIYIERFIIIYQSDDAPTADLVEESTRLAE